MIIKKTLITVAILMATVCMKAQNKSAGINLSIWKNISTQPLDSLQTTYLNIGVQSTMNRLNGAGINILGGVVRKDINGFQASGITNIVGSSLRGIQLSGISNIIGDNMIGVSATGLVNIIGNNTKGVVFSGMTNILGNSSTGLICSGFMNIADKTSSGVQLSGLANITGQKNNGVMASGLLNVVGENMNGLQIAGISNITGKNLNGIQIGLCNYATQVSGLQIGIINYYKEDMKGLQLGLVNVNPSTNMQMMVYGGNTTLANIGLRFKNKLLYTIIGFGTQDQNLNDKFSASASYRAGLALPIYKRLSLSGDLGYQHIETFKNNDEIIPKRLYALQGRINLEYQLTEWFGIFATGGYGITKHYGKSHNFDKGTIVEAGITIF